MNRPSVPKRWKIGTTRVWKFTSLLAWYECYLSWRILETLLTLDPKRLRLFRDLWSPRTLRRMSSPHTSQRSSLRLENPVSFTLLQGLWSKIVEVPRSVSFLFYSSPCQNSTTLRYRPPPLSNTPVPPLHREGCKGSAITDHTPDRSSDRTAEGTKRQSAVAFNDEEETSPGPPDTLSVPRGSPLERRRGLTEVRTQ